MISILWAIVKSALRTLITFWRIVRSFWRVIMTIAFIGLISLNVATLTISGVNAFFSNIIEFVAEGSTLRQRETIRIKKLKADLDSSHSRRRAIQSNLTDERAARRRAQAELSELRPRLARLSNENIAVHQRSALLRDRVKNVTDNVARRTRTIALRNIASMPAEAVPWLGIGVVATVTALEINDACSNIEDLQNLRLQLGISNASDIDPREVCGLRVPTVRELTALVFHGSEEMEKERCRILREHGGEIPEECKIDLLPSRAQEESTPNADPVGIPQLAPDGAVDDEGPSNRGLPTRLE